MCIAVSDTSEGLGLRKSPQLQLILVVLTWCCRRASEQAELYRHQPSAGVSWSQVEQRWYCNSALRQQLYELLIRGRVDRMMRSSMISARSVTTSKDNIRTGNKELPCAVRGSEGATLGSPTAGPRRRDVRCGAAMVAPTTNRPLGSGDRCKDQRSSSSWALHCRVVNSGRRACRRRSAHK